MKPAEITTLITPTTEPTDAELSTALAAAQRAYEAMNQARRGQFTCRSDLDRIIADMASASEVMTPLFSLRVLHALAAARTARLKNAATKSSEDK